MQRVFLFALTAVLSATAARGARLVRVPKQLAEESYQRLNKADCVSTPAEFERAFYAGENRCVKPSVLVGGIDGGAACSVQEIIDAGDPPSNGDILSFVEGNDGLEKYLSFSPIKAIGNYVNNVDFDDPQFPGIQEIHNGQAFAENIGFAPKFSRVDRVIRLTISKVPPVRVAPVVSPKWLTGLPDYVDYLMMKFIRKSAPLSDAARAVLDETNYQSLTNCSATCSFFDTNFPNTDIGGNIAVVNLDGENQRVGNDPSGACINMTDPTNPDRYVQTQPDNHEYKFGCLPEYLDEYLPQKNLTSSRDDIKAAFHLLYQSLTTTTDPMTQALAFRAFVIQDRIDASQLFTGDGFTANNAGGLFIPTSREFIVDSEALYKWTSKKDSRRANIFFCLKPTGNVFFPDENGQCDPNCR